MGAETVAVIDIGSNSIKVLLATRETDSTLRSLGMKTLDARISAGISRVAPVLSEEGMARGVFAVQELVAFAAPHQPSRIAAVATSAVREAQNGDEFCRRVREATGLTVRVLSGEEEANLIGRGLTSDPAIRDFRDFYVFDLGGGSLECLQFRQRRVEQAQSLPLGCVRLTEQFIEDPAEPIAHERIAAIQEHTTRELRASGFRFDAAAARAVFAGGTLTTARVILGLREQRTLEQTSPELPVAALQDLLERMAALPLTQRKQVPGLPPGRADVFPTALATALAVARTTGVRSFHHSLYNLRWGVADELLQPH